MELDHFSYRCSIWAQLYVHVLCRWGII